MSLDAGSDEEVAHRRLLGPAPVSAPGPSVRPLSDGVLFERIGGQATVDRMVDRLYDRFEADAVIRPMFGRDLSNGRRRQKQFFGEWLGGPSRYSESAWGGLHQHHEDLPITPELAERWLGHFSIALHDALPTDDAGPIIDQIFFEQIFERARALALLLINSDASNGLSKHRSQQVASCGVGAQTVKQATRLAERGQVEELAALVAETPDLIGRAPFAARLMQSATSAGSADVVGWLADQGVDPNAPSPLPVRLVGGALELVLFVTPLCSARLVDRPDLSALLLSRGAKEDVFTASFLGDQPQVERLVSERPSLAQIADPATDALTITPIHHAVAGHHLSTLRLLLDHTNEPVRTGSRALRAAAERSSPDMVRLLLERGADGRAVGPGRWVLHPEIAPLLAGAGASAGVGTGGDESGDWVRISCTGNRGRRDDPSFVAALLGHGAGVDQRYNGASPLHYAVKAGFVRTIQVLLEHGADLREVDDGGRTPLDWLEQAAKSVDRDAVRRALATAS